MKSIYNIAGILPAQCRTNPNDCGIAWSEHRSQPIQRPRKAGIKLHVACDSEEISAVYDKAISSIEAFKKAMTETLKPIDPATINVGDTVRLVGAKSTNQRWGRDLTINKDYRVIEVLDDLDKQLTIKIYDDAGDDIWVYTEDLMLVEQA